MGLWVQEEAAKWCSLHFPLLQTLWFTYCNNMATSVHNKTFVNVWELWSMCLWLQSVNKQNDICINMFVLQTMIRDSILTVLYIVNSKNLSKTLKFLLFFSDWHSICNLKQIIYPSMINNIYFWNICRNYKWPYPSGATLLLLFLLKSFFLPLLAPPMLCITYSHHQISQFASNHSSQKITDSYS